MAKIRQEEDFFIVTHDGKDLYQTKEVRRAKAYQGALSHMLENHQSIVMAIFFAIEAANDDKVANSFNEAPDETFEKVIK